MRVGFYQFKPILGEKEKNLNKVSAELSKIKADLIVLPELFATGYLFPNRSELLDLAEPIPSGLTTKTLLQIAKTKKMAIVAGIAEKAQAKIYNSSILVCPNGEVYTYRKIHLFMDEKFLFSPGDKPFSVYRIGKVKIGMLICFDWIFPEASRILALSGAQIICQPANLILPYAHSATLIRALENRVFLILCNRVGQEKQGQKKLKFNGMSQIVAPSGQLIIRAPKNQAMLAIVKINPRQALNKKITKDNDVLADRRPKFYQKLIC